MKTRFGMIILVALVAGACAPKEDDAAGDSANFTEGEGPKAETTIKVGNLTLTKKSFSAKVKAKNPPDEFNPEFDSCETNVEYFQISGTPKDAEINKILKGNWDDPTKVGCEDAMSFDSGQTLRGVDPDQGLLSIVVGMSEFSGGAHPNHGMDFLQLDLRSGKRLSLADYVKADSADKMKELVKQKIATQKIKVDLDQDNPDMRGKKHRFEIRLLDPENQEMMNGFADSYFSSFDEKFHPIPAQLDKIHDFSIAGTGLRIDMSNHLPHALGGMEASYKLLWKDLEGAGILTDTDLIARTKAARPKQPR